MVRRHPALPPVWLISDERNDSALEAALARLPRGSGLIFRHYHLPDPARAARFGALRKCARRYGHLVILADNALAATEWGAHGSYGPPHALRPRRAGLLQLATAHSAAEIALANRLGADAILLSPVFPTRSHPGSAVLGPVRFRLLARLATAPVIALGGMTRTNAQRLGWPRWAAIDGLS